MYPTIPPTLSVPYFPSSLQDVVEHFLHVPSSVLDLPLDLVSSLLPLVCLSGQLTGYCRAFPATRATGKRPSTVPFDVPSPLILYTWNVL